MPKKILIFLIIFLIVFGFVIFNFRKAAKIEAGSGDNVYGWAWANSPTAIETGNGWISFNVTNCADEDPPGSGIYKSRGIPAGCPPAGTVIPNYGVKIDPGTGNLSGYAWAGGGQDAAGNPLPTIGWIRLDPPGDFVTYPGTGYPNCTTNGTCPVAPNHSAQLDFTTRKITGWARACAGLNDDGDGIPNNCQGPTRTDGWDGWILMGPIYTPAAAPGEDFGVRLVRTITGADFYNWAWGSDVVGWVSFNCSNTGVCGTSNYKVMTSLTIPNLPPQALAPTATQGNYCFEPPACPLPPPIFLSWIFWDLDLPFDSQLAYQVQIDNNSDFFLPEVDSCVPAPGTCASGNSSTQYAPLNLAYAATTYYWRVRVWDSGGLQSDCGNPEGWCYPSTSSFTTKLHPYPCVDFDWSPLSPNFNESVQFCSRNDGASCFNDLTTCHAADYSEVACSTWDWTFTAGNPSTSTAQNQTVTYPASTNKTIELTVSDANYACTKIDGLKVGTPLFLPEWKEVPPT